MRGTRAKRERKAGIRKGHERHKPVEGNLRIVTCGCGRMGKTTKLGPWVCGKNCAASKAEVEKTLTAFKAMLTEREKKDAKNAKVRAARKAAKDAQAAAENASAST